MSSNPEKEPSQSKTPTADRLRLSLVRPEEGEDISRDDMTREEFDKIADKMFGKLFKSEKDKTED